MEQIEIYRNYLNNFLIAHGYIKNLLMTGDAIVDFLANFPKPLRNQMIDYVALMRHLAQRGVRVTDSCLQGGLARIFNEYERSIATEQ